MKKFLAILLLGLSSLVTAQTVQTTPNLITSGTNHTWYGLTTGTLPAGCGANNDGGACSGGPQPIYDPATNTISFSYNASASVGQTMAINNALAGVGAGVKINGYNYTYDVRNMNGDDRQGSIDTFTVSQLLRGPANSVLLSSNQYYNTKFEWKTVTGTKVAATPYNIADTSYIQFGITGGDNGYWGGYFGPQVRNVNMSLNYTVDPCATNPAYSPTCPGYAENIRSYQMWGGVSGTQAFAINSALQSSGSGVKVHGFDWGYSVSVGDRFCNFLDIFGGCLGTWIYPSASVNVNLTDNNNATVFDNTVNYGTNTNRRIDSSYRLPESRDVTTLGTFSFNPSTANGAQVWNTYANIVYTPDQCVSNPLSSTSCNGYADAVLAQQCTANPLYNSACPGYAQAMFTQQCNADQLSNPSCPGYAAAYLVQQCNANPLYSTTCNGYTTAQSDCSINPLSHDFCPAYQTAQTQCSANPLYGAFCPGHSTASLECGTNPLSHNYCPTYQAATTSCSTNALTYSFCPGFTSAQLTCSVNPLSNSMCPSFQMASNSCSANSLSYSYCPGYATSNAACLINPLSNTMCSTYTTASAECSINVLSANYCPGNKAAQSACVTNPMSNTMCTGYSTASSECGVNALSHNYCPSYQTALNTCTVNPMSNTLCSNYVAASTSCSANVLNADYCPGYRIAVSTCVTNPLSNTLCSDYQTASSSCTTNPMYANYCTGYQTAVDTCVNNPLSNTMCSSYTSASTACSANPLSASYCPAYQTSTTECTTNPLSHSYCPLNQTATTQCAASALYANYCPGYQFAYACQQDGLYNNQCPNYSTAYAKKMLLEQQGIAGTVATAGTVAQVAAVAAADPANATAQATAVSSDANVNAVVAAKPATASAESSPTAAVKLTPPPPPPAMQMAQAEPKKNDGPSEKKEEKKEEEGAKSNGNSNTGSGPSGDTKPSGQPTSNRQALAERRREAAVKEAVAKGGELANEMGKASDLEAQKAVQNVVIQAMGFTPGFDAYNKAMIPDTTFYKPFTVYGNQKNVDNQQVSRRLMGGSDRTHQEMVDSQFQLGK